MKKRFVFLTISLLIGFGIVYFGRSSEDPKVTELIHDIECINNDHVDIIEYAEEVLDEVTEQKIFDEGRIVSLDSIVTDSELTIEQQVRELRRSLIRSNEFKQLAEDNSERALLMERMANEQKARAELARMEAQKRLNMALNENFKQAKRIVELENIISGGGVVVDDTLILPMPIPIDDKKKKGNRRKDKY